VIAVLFFGLGDLVTTLIGLRVAGVAEANPVVTRLSQQPTLGAIVVLKTIVFGTCYLLWKHIPQPHCGGVPLSLATVGVLVTTWNLHILLLTVAP